jgi:oxygen-dependent protoporphyrinogen oxidase
MRLAVVGGGLSGLTVAYRRSAAGDDVVLFEGSTRVGGQIRTQRDQGYIVEHGAEGFVASSSALPALAGSLGIAGDLVGQLASSSYGFDGTNLVQLGPGEAAQFLGFQVPRDELGKGIRTFAGGMGQLADALAASVGRNVDVRLATPVESVVAGPEGGARWRVLTRGGAVDVDAVVVATGARAAADILQGPFGEAATGLRVGQTAPSCTVSLTYARTAIRHPLDGTGCVVAESCRVDGFRACTFTSSKFAGRAPEGWASLRLFFRPTDDDFAMDDAQWIGRARDSLARILGVDGPPTHAWVARWPGALPIFDPPFRAAVGALEVSLAHQAVLLAGAAFHGPGLDAAVRSAEAAARALSAIAASTT